MRFRAAVLVESHNPLVLDEIDLPVLTCGQVLVRIECSGICGAQLNEIDAVKGPDKFLPHLLGHEAVGEVLECGIGVTVVKPGDRVVLHWRKGAGIQAAAAVYHSPSLGRINAGWVTTFSEMAVVSENRMTPIPKDFDGEAGALMGCAVTTAMGTLSNDARLKPGESLVIIGVGGIGLSMVQAARLMGAWPIVGVDIRENRLELARKLGASHIVIGDRPDLERTLRDIVGNDGADVVVDNTGLPKQIEMAYALCGPVGRTVLVGVMAKDRVARIQTYPLHFDKTIIGSSGGHTNPTTDIPRYIKLCKAGLLDLKPLIGKRYQLSEINQAISDMRGGIVAGRCLIHM